MCRAGRPSIEVLQKVEWLGVIVKPGKRGGPGSLEDCWAVGKERPKTVMSVLRVNVEVRTIFLVGLRYSLRWAANVP